MGDVLNFPTGVSIPQAHKEVSGEWTMWDKCIQNYLRSMVASGRRPATVRLHRQYVTDLSRIAKRPQDVRRDHLERWLTSRVWKPETQRSARTVAVLFFRWAEDTGVVRHSPAANLARIRPPKALARPLPEPIFLDAIARADERMRAILLLGRYCGLRIGEIVAVHTRNLDGDMLYVTGKGGKTRVVPVTNAELLTTILAARGWVFPSSRGTSHITPIWASTIVSEFLPSPWTAHTLRHSFATHAYDASRDLLALAQVLGHESPETTRRYVAVPMDALRAVTASAA